MTKQHSFNTFTIKMGENEQLVKNSGETNEPKNTYNNKFISTYNYQIIYTQ